MRAITNRSNNSVWLWNGQKTVGILFFFIFNDLCVVNYCNPLFTLLSELAIEDGIFVEKNRWKCDVVVCACTSIGEQGLNLYRAFAKSASRIRKWINFKIRHWRNGGIMEIKKNSWMWVSLLLCVFGFFREIRPSEPFSIEFFISWRNLTNEDLTQYVYPVGTYSFLAQLIIVFLITDMLR